MEAWPFDLVATLTLVASGIAFIYVGVQVFRSWRAASWPLASGYIASARAVHRATAEGDADFDYVAYRYEVGARWYRNDRWSFGPQVLPASVVPALDPEGPAGDAVRVRYPKGKPLQVRYNPRDPSESVVRAMPSIEVYALAGAAALATYLAISGKL